MRGKALTDVGAVCMVSRSSCAYNHAGRHVEMKRFFNFEVYDLSSNSPQVQQVCIRVDTKAACT